MEFCQSTGFRHFVCDTIGLLGLLTFTVTLLLIIYKFILVGVWCCLRRTFKSLRAIFRSFRQRSKPPRRWMYLDYHTEPMPTTISQSVIVPNDYDPPPEYPHMEVDASPPAYQSLRFDWPV